MPGVAVRERVSDAPGGLCASCAAFSRLDSVHCFEVVTVEVNVGVLLGALGRDVDALVVGRVPWLAVLTGRAAAHSGSVGTAAAVGSRSAIICSDGGETGKRDGNAGEHCLRRNSWMGWSGGLVCCFGGKTGSEEGQHTCACRPA